MYRWYSSTVTSLLGLVTGAKESDPLAVNVVKKKKLSALEGSKNTYLSQITVKLIFNLIW